MFMSTGLNIGQPIANIMLNKCFVDWSTGLSTDLEFSKGMKSSGRHVGIGSATPDSDGLILMSYDRIDRKFTKANQVREYQNIRDQSVSV